MVQRWLLKNYICQLFLWQKFDTERKNILLTFDSKLEWMTSCEVWVF